MLETLIGGRGEPWLRRATKFRICRLSAYMRQPYSGSAILLASLLPLCEVTAQEPPSSIETRDLDRATGDESVEERQARSDPSNPTDADPSETTDMATVTVTGTRIRGGTSPSPVITIGAENIREEGFTDLGEVIRSVPQNFSGGQNPGVAGGATTGAGGLANQNLTGGSSLNLRGLGPDATLTLLNGRRMSYGGFVQAVDISAIPVEAVERIEILPDGASAVYGSDAVGGVGNVILQRDYDGVTAGVRYGGATEGGLATREYTATAGTVWSGGGLIATWKKASTDPVFARQRGYTRHMSEPTTLYPASHLRSGLLSVHQSLGSAAELHLDALRTERDQTQYPYNTSLLPWYNVLAQESEATLVDPGVDIFLPGDWTLRLGAGWGKDKLVSRQTRVSLADGALDPRSNDCYCNEVSSWEAGAEGPVFTLPAGEARLAVGTGYRKTEFAQRQRLTDTVAIQGSESSRFAYAEFNLLLVGPDMDVAWARRLELSFAARGEDYDSFGAVTTPKLGLVYGPGPDVTFKASWGRSFKAPTLFQRYWARQALLRSAADFGPGHPADATVLMLGGGNPDLEPERAVTRSASLAIHPEALPALTAELTWFDIDYTDRVVQPITDPNGALENPDYAQLISHEPTLEEQAGVIDGADIFYNLVDAPYDPGNVVAVMYANYANVARQRIRGFDVSASYRLDLGTGRLAMRGSASWLDSSQQSTPDAESYDLAGILFGPARVRSRVGAVWTDGGLSVSGFANYTGGVTGPSADGRREKSASFTTFDTTVRYGSGPGHGVWSGLEFALSVRNLFNRAPPLYVPAQADFPPYDSTNYSAIGRFVSLSVSKRF
ncbi:TonB-dependent receptor plug domain-containing protein [Luteimonas sp. 22616]|uniref:TonB-dependent receptor plug domain-containing protein n=1 Tax=Luteimonas sp. 22616 TaxID=3453951 RepID=UPI003F86490C